MIYYKQIVLKALLRSPKNHCLLKLLCKITMTNLAFCFSLNRDNSLENEILSKICCSEKVFIQPVFNILLAFILKFFWLFLECFRSIRDTTVPVVLTCPLFFSFDVLKNLILFMN